MFMEITGLSRPSARRYMADPKNLGVLQHKNRASQFEGMNLIFRTLIKGNIKIMAAVANSSVIYRSHRTARV